MSVAKRALCNFGADMDYSFLAELKEGDQVIVASMFHNSVGRVERVTKTQILVGGIRFRKQDGLVGATGWPRDRLLPATPEAIQDIRDTSRRVRLRNKIRDLLDSRADIPLDVLEKLHAIVQPLLPQPDTE